MPVTSTPLDILRRAYSRSTKNTPARLVTESTEGLDIVQQAMRGIYAVAARVAPEHFATSEAVSFSSPGWTRPAAAESIYRIETSGGAEVAVVPHDDRTLEAGIRPAVYYLGGIYRNAGNTGDPTSGSLTFFYSRRPTLPASYTSPLDTQWEEPFNELLALEVAIYLAEKDGGPRLEELPSLVRERNRWLARFLAYLEHQSQNERRRFSREFPGIVPLTALLAGGEATSA